MDAAASKPHISRPLREFLIIGAAWTAAVAAMFALYFINLREQREDIFLFQARIAHDKDITYRYWNAAHGGVYVPVTPATQPNPYLDVPQKNLVTTDGLRLTLINPAYMTRQVHELGGMFYGMRGHITSLAPLRPENHPDPWEETALQTMQQAGLAETHGFSEIDGKPYFRYIHRLLVESPCLRCHAKQGYKEGDFRGGISVSIPASSMDKQYNQSAILAGCVFAALWLLGLLMLAHAHKRVRLQIADLGKTGGALAQSLDRQKILLKEVHHRVKNNLQIIVSLLSLQSERISDPELKDIFNESSSRIFVMALAHERLHKEDIPACITMRDYLSDLTAHIEKSQSLPGRSVAVRVAAQGACFDVGMTFCCGLIVNELVVNSFKHAFAGREQGVIDVRLDRDAGTMILSVTDDGVGPPPGFDPKAVDSLGLALVFSLAEQLHGGFTITREAGKTRAAVSFPDPEAKA